MENLGVKAERFVRYYEDGIQYTAAVSVNEAVQVAVNFVFATRVDDQRIQTSAEPLVNFVLPILRRIHQTALR